MKYVFSFLIAIIPFIGHTQSADISTAKKYAKMAIKKEFNQSNVRNISIRITEWDYNRSTGRFNIEYTATYEYHSVAFWSNSSENKCIVQCDLDGTNARFKYVEAFSSWRNWSTLYPD